jgi:hypothetical protein
MTTPYNAHERGFLVWCRALDIRAVFETRSAAEQFAATLRLRHRAARFVVLPMRRTAGSVGALNAHNNAERDDL